MVTRTDLRIAWMAAAVVAATLSLRASEPLQQTPARVQAAGEVETSLLLIGDAGGAAPGGDPVLRALGRDVARLPAETVVVYLGDNVYPDGLPPDAASGRAQAEQRLRAQVEAGRAAARLIFIPGNHDWDKTSGARGWDGVRRQAAWLSQAGVGRVEPPAGCPGPSVSDIGRHLRVVFLDTEWWLRDQPRPDAADGCEASTGPEVVDRLAAALRSAGGRWVIVAAHHPPVSAGPHGGHFGVLDHLFPLRALHPRLWIPLPGVGSVYPLARRAGALRQDQAHSSYREMVSALARAYAVAPPLLVASGHEHQLGVFRGAGTGARYVLVSGAGTVDHEDAPRATQAALFTSGRPGFARLDVEASGRVRLAVLVLDRTAALTEAFSTWLE